MVDCIQHNSIQCDNQGTASRWWRHQMETFSALLSICVGNSPVICDFPAQRPVTRSFDVFFDLRLNKWLSNQWWGWWFEMPSRPLWRHCNVTMITTWDGNEIAFQMAGPVQGKSTGHCGVSLKRDSEIWTVDILFDSGMNKLLNKQLSYWWFAITWHLCDVKVIQTHMRHPISRPCGWAMGCLLWVFWKNLTYYNGTELNHFYT